MSKLRGNMSLCVNCAHLAAAGTGHPDEITYVCRRFPPNGGGWPIVQRNDWCGEFSGGNEPKVASAMQPYRSLFARIFGHD